MTAPTLTERARAVIAGLSVAQLRMIAGADSDLPPGGSRDAGRSAANWWRTRAILVRRGLLRDEHPARSDTRTELGAAVAIAAIVAGHHPVAAGCLRLLSEGDGRAIRCYGFRGALAMESIRRLRLADKLTITPLGREVARLLAEEPTP